jgi:hypothetical protein
VLVSAEHDVDVAVDEERLEDQPQDARAGGVAAGGVDGVVKITDFPERFRPGQLLLQPGQLSGVEPPAVEHEEPDAGAGKPSQPALVAAERVVAAPFHVEAAVVDLAGRIVIPNRGVKCDAGIEQRAVRLFELGDVILRRVGRIDVVPEHHDEVEGELRAPRDHLPRDLVLRLVAAP